jgi:hypothetical protein
MSTLNLPGQQQPFPKNGKSPVDLRAYSGISEAHAYKTEVGDYASGAQVLPDKCTVTTFLPVLSHGDGQGDGAR